MKNKRISSHVGIQICYFFLMGYLIAFVMTIFEAFVNIPLPPVYLLWRIREMMEWPQSMILGLVISGSIVICRWTVVEVTREHVFIRRLFTSKMLRLEDFVKHEVRNKEIMISALYLKLSKAYLVFNTSNATKKYRLYAFRDKQMEAVLEQIRLQRNRNLSIEEKIEIQDAVNENVFYADEEVELEEELSNNEFFFPVNVFVRCEKQRVKYVMRILLIVGAILLIGTIQEIASGDMIAYDASVAIIACVVMISAYPVLMWHISKRSKMCPERIFIDGEHIWVDKQCFHFNNVTSIELTSVHKATDSVYAVQYYMTIYQLGEYYKFWLGSEGSNAGYSSFCQVLERALVMYPEKIRYKK